MEYFSIQELGLSLDVWKPFAHHHHAVRYAAGQLIYLQDTPADLFYYLKHGRVKTFISSADGTEKTLTVYQAGNLFGEASFFDELPRVSSAVAATDCELVPINRTMAAAEIGGNPELAMALLKYLARTVRLLSEHVDDMAFLRADQRIARFLLSIPAENNGSVSCTQEEIAAAVSVSRMTASRVLKAFSAEGILTTGYGFIRITNRTALEAKL